MKINTVNNIPEEMMTRNYILLFSKLHWLMMMIILPMTATAPSVSHQCQQITIPMCKNIPYNTTLVPNYFNHETQVLASDSIGEFWPLVENNCSPDVRFFLCSLYAPVCTILDMPIPPCQNFCKNVKSSCRRVMRQYNLSWPKSIKCMKFPHEEGLCVNSITESLGSEVPLTTTSPGYSPEAFKGAQTDGSVPIDHCEPLQVPFCKDLPYNTTVLPNYFKHQTQHEAAVAVSAFSRLVEFNCSSELKLFLCSLYAPVCTILEMPIPPCQSLCQSVKSSCRRAMTQNDMLWPEYIRCDELPPEGELCISSLMEYPDISLPNSTSKIPVISEDTIDNHTDMPDNCEPVSIPLCKGLPYNTTFMPNLLNHQTQEDASLEINQFNSLVMMNCSPDLTLFLCSLYVPVWRGTGSPLPPCHNLCLSVKNGCRDIINSEGSRLPQVFNCDKFPIKKNNDMCVDNSMFDSPVAKKLTEVISENSEVIPSLQRTRNKSPTILTDSEDFSSICEPLTITFCKNIFFSPTVISRLLKQHLKVDEIIDVYQMYPIIQEQCHSSEFNCTINSPRCQELRYLMSCDNLCYIAEECRYEFPETLECGGNTVWTEHEKDGICVWGKLEDALRTSPTPTSPQINFKDQTNRHTTIRDKCDPITVPLCNDLPYNTTRMPNYFNHTTQENAGLEIHQYWPLIKINCSPDLRLFLCSLYLPLCNGQDPSIPPCRNLCLSAKSGCEEIMMNFGFPWPEALSCDAFPVSPYEEHCILGMNGTDIFIPSTVPSTISLSKQSGMTSESQCEPITVDLCKDLPYNTTMRSELFDYLSQEEAGLKVGQFYPLVMTQCSSDLRLFLCSTYLPVCNVQGPPIHPCRNLCLSVKSGCEELIRRFGFQWPESLNCDKFPESSHEEHCISGMIGKEMIISSVVSTIPPPNHSEMTSEIQCEPIIVPLCKDLPYSTTRMPNHFNHTTQEYAGLEIHQFWPLVDLNCSPDLRLFLCSAYLPLCNDQGISMPPCRNLCLSAKSGCEEVMMRYGFHWPESLACDRCPESSHEEHCISGMIGESITASMVSFTSSPSNHTGIPLESQCEPITIHMCKDLPYNTLMMPEHFNYLSQDDAGLQLHQFFPLVKIVCSPDLQLFLCTAYVPVCNSQDPPVLPCRKLCLSAVAGCGSLMRQFGFQFPEFLACDRFPDETNGDHCVIGVNASGVVYSNPKLPIVSPSATSKQTYSTANLDSFYEHCEKITFSMCRDLPYNFTTLPNILNHSTQHEAAFAIFQLRPILQAKCSPDLQLMLCSIFLPPCSIPQRARLPCRDLCLSVRNGCEDFMNRHGVAWPSTLDCATLPDASQETCVGRVTSGH